jgi:muramoyltetrapeptide carboxypeptidase
MAPKSLIFFTCSMLFAFCNNLIFSQSQKPMHSVQYINPPYLSKGDTIAIIAPAGQLLGKSEALDLAVSQLQSWGLKVVVGANILETDGHFAGDDDQRRQVFQEMLDDPSIKAIWCARGGYGSMRIMDQLDFSKFQVKPKWIIGYSDVTAFHSQLHQLHFATIHGMMAVNFENDLEDIKLSIASLKDALFGKSIRYEFDSNSKNQLGEVKAPVIGGNLSLLSAMLGSETAVDFCDKIIFIEEIGEYMYEVDRMIQSLRRSGAFQNCAGVLVGDFTNIKENSPDFGKTLEEIVLEAVGNPSIPIAFGFPAGHEKDNRAIYFGRSALLKITEDSSILKY